MRIRKISNILIVAIVMLVIALALSACDLGSTDKITDENGDKYTVSNSPEREENIVSFGQYPQTEVSDNELLSALDKKAGDVPTAEDSGKWKSYGYKKSGGATLNMWYTDVVYKNDRYRGTYFTESRIGKEYSYVASRVYWFKFEPIEWTVIEDNRGELLLLSNMALDAQEFTTELYYKEQLAENSAISLNNYEYSLLRSWLNSTFYDTAFTEKQKKYIVLSDVDNSSSSRYACNNTQDYVFILSEDEAYSERYGFTPYSNAWLYGASGANNDPLRAKKATDYARAQGCGVNTDSSYYAREQRGNACWWLRTPDESYSGMVYYVNFYGSPHNTSMVTEDEMGVVPAIKIKMN